MITSMEAYRRQLNAGGVIRTGEQCVRCFPTFAKADVQDSTQRSQRWTSIYFMQYALSIKYIHSNTIHKIAYRSCIQLKCYFTLKTLTLSF